MLCGCSKPAADSGQPVVPGASEALLPPSEAGPLGKMVPVSDVTSSSQNGPVSQAFGLPDSQEPGQIGGLGQPDVADGTRGPDADYIDKSDVYWKLNWIKKKLTDGDLPPNFVDAVLKARHELEATDRDSNFNVAADAIGHLDRGIEHLEAVQALDTAMVESDAIPWGSGTRAMRRFIDSGGLGFGQKRDMAAAMDMSTGALDKNDLSIDLMSAPTSMETGSHLFGLSPQQQKAVEIVMDYESRYHMSPDRVMRDEWRSAMERIDNLRDDLGLMNRPENRDNDVTEPGVNMQTSRVQLSATDMKGVDGVVPIPSVAASALGSGEARPRDASKPVRSMDDNETAPESAQ